MDRQDVFNRVKNHLLTQGARSVVSSDGLLSCVYRAPDGLKCAIGVLISDKCYYPGLEWYGVEDSPVLEALKCSGVVASDVGDLGLLDRLQDIHDNYNIETWPNALQELAEECGLVP